MPTVKATYSVSIASLILSLYLEHSFYRILAGKSIERKKNTIPMETDNDNGSDGEKKRRRK
jgi:hypothetical protein